MVINFHLIHLPCKEENAGFNIKIKRFGLKHSDVVRGLIDWYMLHIQFFTLGCNFEINEERLKEYNNNGFIIVK